MTSKEKIKEIEDFIDFLEEKCIITSSDTAKTRLNLNTILKDLEKLEKIRKTLKVEKEETINQNLYWLYIEKRPILITRKIYDLVKDELEEDENNEKL